MFHYLKQLHLWAYYMQTKKNKLITYAYFACLFINYEFFIVITTLVIFLHVFKIKEFYLEATVSKFILSIFYIFKYLSAIFNFDIFWKLSSLKSYHSNAKFLDMQAFLIPIKCRSLNGMGKIKIIGTEDFFECSFKSSYGPLDQLFSINLNLFFTTFLFSLLLTLFLLKISFEILNHNQKNIFVISIIFLSPPLNFLHQRMNIDLFIFIVIYYVSKKYFKNQSFLFYFLLILLSLIKIYIIFIFIIYSIYYFLIKEYKLLLQSSFSLFSSLFIYYYYGYFESISNLTSIKPYRPDRVYGIYAEVIKLEKLGLKNFYLIFIIIFIIYSIYFYKEEKLLNRNNNIFTSIEVWPSLFLFLGTCLYTNYDYRIALLIFISYIFLEVDTKYKFVFLIFLYSHPSLIHGYKESFAIVESNFIYFLDTTFLIFLHFIFIDFIAFLKNQFFIMNKENNI